MLRSNNLYHGKDSHTQKILNYNQALNQLKHAESMIDRKKKHLRVLAIRAQRGGWKIEEEQHKQQMKLQIKTDNQKMQDIIYKINAEQKQRLIHLRKQSQKIRQQRLKNSARSRLQVLQLNMRIKDQIKKKSLQHASKIINFRRIQLESKRSKRQSVYQNQKMIQIALDERKSSRISDLRSSRSRQRDEILNKIKLKQTQLASLDQIQPFTTIPQSKEKSLSMNSRLKSVNSSSWIDILYKPTSQKSKNRKKSASSPKLYDNSISNIPSLYLT